MNLAGIVQELLSDAGALARSVPGFESRAGQIVLAREIADTIEAGEHLVAEAGTGIGKTLAYLVPILSAGCRAVVSTATLTLQDQLYERDLPLVARALGRPFRVAVLKGRRNYLCRERYLRAGAELPGIAPGAQDSEVLAAWVRTTHTGDLAELPDLGERSYLARLLSVSADGCLGANCPEFARCHLYAARRAAQNADVVIVNHHLLVADFAMKAEGVSDLLGAAEVVVVDEAHALPEIARLGMSASLMSAELSELAEEAGRLPGGMDERGALELAGAVRDVLALRESGRRAWQEAEVRLTPALVRLSAALQRLGDELDAWPEAELLRARALSCAGRLVEFMDVQDDAEHFRWVEGGPQGRFALHRTPLATGAILADWIDATGASWIFTSATLAVAGRFDGIFRDLGLSAVRSLVVESPFDYSRQARLYLPRGLPDVDDPNYTDSVVAAAEPLVEAAGGGCFLLFTSRLATARAARGVRTRDWPYPLFVQDEAPRARLLDGFREAGNGVLIGTASFWEGVDVKGDALVLVVIDRLPFDSPADPLLRARLEYSRSHGGNPFADIQLPEAVMALKQGAGRLIRDRSDRGVLMICDPRIRTRSYGRVFLASLPPMGRIDELSEALGFLAGLERTEHVCA